MVSNRRYIGVYKRTYVGRQVRHVYGDVYRGKYVSGELGDTRDQTQTGIGVRVDTYGYIQGMI